MKTACMLLSLGIVLSGPGSSAEQRAPIFRSETLFLQEGFNGSGIPPGWSVHQISGPPASWTVVGTGTNPPIPPYAGMGQAKFNSYDAAGGAQSRLTTPAVDLTSASDPFIDFFFYHDEEFITSLDSVYVEVSVADSVNGPWQILAGYQRPESPNAWKREAVSLFSYGGTARIFVSLRGVSKFGNNMYVDEFRIADSSFHDIGITAVDDNAGAPPTIGKRDLPRTNGCLAPMNGDSGPLVFRTGQPVTVNAIVQNFGTFAEPAYRIDWRIDGVPQPPVSNSGTLARNARDTLALTWGFPSTGTHTLTAWTFLESDSNQSNDTLRLTFVVPDSSIIFSELFNAQPFPPPGWSVINRDGGALQPWFQGSSLSAFLPYEGTGFAADNFQRSNGTYLDDYLISPAITGVGQPGNLDSIVFRARSAFHPPPAVNYPDSLMIRVSTSGVDTSNFTTLLDYCEVPKTGWTRFQYSLTGVVPPNSTVHIAFRYLHFASGPGGANSDFIGVDAFQAKRSLPTGRGEDAPLPETFGLWQNYPNPFNPVTSIAYDLTERQVVSIKIFDVLGAEIAILMNGIANPGRQVVHWDATGHSSGIYFCRMVSREGIQTKKMVLLK